MGCWGACADGGRRTPGPIQAGVLIARLLPFSSHLAPSYAPAEVPGRDWKGLSMGLPSKASSEAAGLPHPDQTPPACRDRAATGNCGSSWKSLSQAYHPHHERRWFGGRGSSAASDRSCTARTLRTKIYGKETRSFRFGFETRLI